jgi:hypothetical protein
MENAIMDKKDGATINFLQKNIFSFPFKKQYREGRRDIYIHMNVKKIQN